MTPERLAVWAGRIAAWTAITVVTIVAAHGVLRIVLRTDGFEHVADIMVGSFYDPELDEGCAFEELISFHGGLGGPQTRPFVMHPVELPVPSEPIIGAAAVHELLSGWRVLLSDTSTSDSVTATA